MTFGKASIHVQDLADRYFAEQCRRLGPIEGRPVPLMRTGCAAPVKKAAPAGTVTKSARSRKATRAHLSQSELLDRFRL